MGTSGFCRVQFGVVFPDWDMIVVMTAATEQTQEVMDSLRQCLVPAAADNAIEENTLAQVLEEKLAALAILPLGGKRQSQTESRIDGRTFYAGEEAEEYCSSMEILIGGVALYHVEEGKTEKMSFGFSDSGAQRESSLCQWNEDKTARSRPVRA